MTDLHQAIRKFVVDHFLFGEDNGLPGDASFLEMGVVDSTGVLELVSHLEQTYKIKVADQDLVPENLDSINSIVNYLRRERPELAAG